MSFRTGPAGNPTGIEDGKGALLDHEDRFVTRQFVNSSVHCLAECLLAYMGERNRERFRESVHVIDPSGPRGRGVLVTRGARNRGNIVKLGPSVRGSIRQFAFWVANRSVGHPLLEGIDIGAIFEEPSALEAAFAVFCNVLEVDEYGQVTNFKQAERRAAEHIRRYCDANYHPEVPFEDWEVELHPVSADRWNG